MPTAAEAVANLRSEGAFRFEATTEITGFDAGPVSASGVIDVAKRTAHYHPSTTEALREQGVIAVGKHLYMPDGEQASDRWIRTTLNGERESWVSENILPMDGGALLGLVALENVHAGGVPHAQAQGLRCSYAPVMEGSGEIEYCVDEEARLRSLERTIDEGSVAVTYAPAPTVEVTVPPEDRVTDIEIDDSSLLSPEYARGPS
jgi:hypothetical protein